ncbi:MAG: hypothetical protein R6U63_12330 [Longimicrobiales bacterium]
MTRITALVATLAFATGLVGCSDASGPGEPEGPDDGVNFTWDGGTYHAAGLPSFSGQEIEPETFAIAFPDSVGGLVVSGFERKEGTVGDLFIIQLVQRATGTFTCGVGQNCHGRILEGVDATDLQSVQTYWEIESGTVTVDTLTDDHIVGHFDGLVLGDDGTGATRSIENGTFDLELLSEADGVDIMRCFLTRVTGGTCQ